MIGQSVVHTGSRKVISTTLPRRLASETVRPSWSVSEKPGAGTSRLALLPAMARARIGSAVRFAAAEAIGAAPIKITTSAATAATDRALAVASVAPSARGRSHLHPGAPPLPADSSATTGLFRHGGLLRRGYQGQVAGREQQGHRDHAVRVGSEAAQEAEILHQHPVGQAEHDPERDRVPDQPGSPGQEDRAHRGQRDHHDQVDREAMAGDERAEAGQQGRKDVRLRGARHRLDHPGERSGLAVHRARPETAARPGLKQRHAEEEQPQAGQQQAAHRQAAGPRPAPGALRQRDERARDHVEQDGAGCPGQPAQARREDPAERLPEDPHDQAPADAGRPGQPGPGPARGDDEPAANADLDPDARGAGLDGVIRPGGAAPVDQVLHPRRRCRRGRLDDLGGQAAGHLRLRLQDPVEDPQQAEPDAQQPPSPGFRRRARRARRPALGGRRGDPPGTRRGPDEPQEDDRDESDGALVEQRRPEGGDQRRVGRVQA